MRKGALYILLLFTGVFINSCKMNPYYYITEDNDTVVMYVYKDEEYSEKWNVILKDSVESQKELHDIFVKSGLFHQLKSEADNSDQRFSKEFFIYFKKDVPSFESCDHSNFYMQGFLIGPSAVLKETRYRYLLNTKEEYKSTQRDISNEISKQMEKITNATLQGKKPYYGKSLNECPHVPKLAKFKPPRCPIGVYWNTLCLMRDVWTIKTYMI